MESDSLDPELKNKISKRIKELAKVETRYNIAMVIHSFGTSNIQRISEYLGKNKATIHHHIKEMVTGDLPYLELAQEDTVNKQGKFYKLNKYFKRYFDVPPPESKEKITEFFLELGKKSEIEISKSLQSMLTSSPNFGSAGEIEKKNLQYNHVIEKIILENFIHSEKSLFDGKKPVNKKYGFASIDSFSYSAKLSSHKQLLKIVLEINGLLTKLSELRENFDKENENIPENELVNVHLTMVLGESTKFKFE